MDTGIQLGRRFRSLKLWIILRYFGAEGFAAQTRANTSGLRKSSPAGSTIIRTSSGWRRSRSAWSAFEPVHPRDRGQTRSSIASNEEILETVNRSGRIYISHTRLHGRYTLRVAIGHIRTTAHHVGEAWRLLEQAAHDLVAARRS